MYYIILTVIGLTGIALPWLIAWLVFINPYTEMANRWLPFWIFLGGIVVGILTLLATLAWWASVWPKD